MDNFLHESLRVDIQRLALTQPVIEKWIEARGWKRHPSAGTATYAWRSPETSPAKAVVVSCGPEGDMWFINDVINVLAAAAVHGKQSFTDAFTDLRSSVTN